jgi:hypothetical protein
MHHLYDGNPGYSQEVILGERTNHAMWTWTRGEVLKSLRGTSFDNSAAIALETLPLELWSATNGFNDNFSVLYMKVPISQFIKLARDAGDATGSSKYTRIAEVMRVKGSKIRFISMDGSEDSSSDVITPELTSTSATVELALENLNTLLQHSRQGPTSAVDRIHTALHAHLVYLCEANGQTPNASADLDALFSLLRNGHPKVSERSDTIFRSLSKVIHALSPIRNENSLAHPGEALLEEPEAMLVLNAGRTLLRYLDSRFAKPN